MVQRKKQTDRQIDQTTERQRQTEKVGGSQTDIQIYRHTVTNRQIGKHTGKEQNHIS